MKNWHLAIAIVISLIWVGISKSAAPVGTQPLADANRLQGKYVQKPISSSIGKALTYVNVSGGRYRHVNFTVNTSALATKVRMTQESSARQAHSARVDNPHNTTATQVGAPTVAKMTNESTARKAVDTDLQSHKNSIIPAGGHPAAGNNRQIQYNNSGAFAGAAQLNYSASKLGIGTSNPSAPLHVADTVNVAARGIIASQHNNGSAAASITFQKSRGTITSPSTLIGDDQIGLFQAQYWNGSAYVRGAQFGFKNDSTAGRKPNGTNFPTAITFVTSETGVSGLTERFTIASNGNVGIGNSAPTQRLNVGRGFKIYSAGRYELPKAAMPLPTEEGLIWKNQHTFYGNQYQVTRSFNMAHGIVTSDTTVGNTTTETTVYTAAQAANYPTAGKTIRIKLLGYLSKTAAATLTIRLKVGSTTLLTSTVAATGAPLTNVPLHGDWYFTYRTVGASGTCISSAAVDVNNISIDSSATATTTVDTTAANNITVTFQWSAADAGNTTTVTQGYTETLGDLELKNIWYAMHMETLARREDAA